MAAAAAPIAANRNDRARWLASWETRGRPRPDRRGAPRPDGGKQNRRARRAAPWGHPLGFFPGAGGGKGGGAPARPLQPPHQPLVPGSHLLVRPVVDQQYLPP